MSIVTEELTQEQLENKVRTLLSDALRDASEHLSTHQILEVFGNEYGIQMTREELLTFTTGLRERWLEDNPESDL